eukprot:TRINITY_DN24826_c0_g1_i1.p1 TRINITY_DN24826_c0_g1~~TRINITY_DN24826_c0_g1_i1.p1  ORF type:complete len:103 (+),score=21.88 TRINITY_DN24826_c0_g1_i1:134-442(+)
MIRRPPRSTQGVSSAASDVYKRQGEIRMKQKQLMTSAHKFAHESLIKNHIGMKAQEFPQEPALRPLPDPELDIPDFALPCTCLLYTSPSPRDLSTSRMPSSA